MKTSLGVNIRYPVLIEAGDGSGSGFYVKNKKSIFLVTATHVLFDSNAKLLSKKIQLTSYGHDLEKDERITIEVNLLEVEIRRSKDKDIVVVELGKTDDDKEEGSFSFHWGKGVIAGKKPTSGVVIVPAGGLSKFDEVGISNDVFVLGYPNSVGLDGQIDKTMPLLRKGVVAGKNKDRGTIVLDCPVYFGNSGGIVIEVEVDDLGKRKFKVIGVVSQYVPFIEKLFSLQLKYINKNYENSGYAIAVPIDDIFELTEEKPIKPEVGSETTLKPESRQK